ncbi:hypothetical protein H4Q26_008383 [Puccinia striiformis f. sp. tritici PST-130]|nr:hypothetical protein H4Q26_008383 [Puccinia striiformis f. sp. tritici PST-130]
MIKRELAKNPKLAEENWIDFCQIFTKRKKAKQAKAAKESESEQHQPSSSGIDLELESGEYFEKKSRGLTTTRDKPEELSSSKSKKVEGKN